MHKNEMNIAKLYAIIKKRGPAKGFTLIELMIVVVIIGILATGVVTMFADPVAKVKAVAFNMRGDINLARAVAVAENEDVLIDFLFDVEQECQKDITKCVNAGDSDGYIICIDLDDPVNNICDATDTIIRISLFREEVQFYNPTATPPGGPGMTPGGVATIIGKTGVITDDGGATAIGFFIMEPDGTLEDTITDDINIVVYVPQPGDHNIIKGAPYVIVVNASTGRVRLERWRGSWQRK